MLNASCSGADPEISFRGGPTLTMFFFFVVDEGREDEIPLYQRAIIGSTAKSHLTLNAGLVALWFYRGSGPVLVSNPIFL